MENSMPQSVPESNHMWNLSCIIFCFYTLPIIVWCIYVCCSRDGRISVKLNKQKN